MTFKILELVVDQFWLG